MTHEELLRRITIVGDTSIEEALRAVVELHAPQTVSWAYGGKYCDQCSTWNKPDKSGLKKWPCGTIQVIEKELG